MQRAAVHEMGQNLITHKYRNTYKKITPTANKVFVSEQQKKIFENPKLKA